METVDSQQQSYPNPRLDHALTYCTIRALELDMGYERNTLIVKSFGKHALSVAGDKSHQGEGYDVI